MAAAGVSVSPLSDLKASIGSSQVLGENLGFFPLTHTFYFHGATVDEMVHFLASETGKGCCAMKRGGTIANKLQITPWRSCCGQLLCYKKRHQGHHSCWSLHLASQPPLLQLSTWTMIGHHLKNLYNSPERRRGNPSAWIRSPKHSRMQR